MWEWEGWAAAAAGVVAVCLAAALVRERRRHRRSLDEHRWLAEREREGAAREAVEGERSRIARELHDIVSHTVSLMVVQASAAREVLGTAPDEAAAAMAAVEGAGRDALTELRHLLGLLAPAADGSEDAPGGGVDDLSPQPGLRRLGELIDRIAFAGLPVEVRIAGEPRPLPTGVDVTAYRIVQEALTNALKHGQCEKAEVVVRYAVRVLRIEVLNDGPSVLTDTRRTPAAGGPGAGQGLVGLRERVALYGGHLDARRRLGGGYRVRARIPLDGP